MITIVCGVNTMPRAKGALYKHNASTWDETFHDACHVAQR